MKTIKLEYESTHLTYADKQESKFAGNRYLKCSNSLVFATTQRQRPSLQTRPLVRKVTKFVNIQTSFIYSPVKITENEPDQRI